MSISDPKAENLNGIYRNACDLIAESHYKGSRFRNMANFFGVLTLLVILLALSGLVWVEPFAQSKVQEELRAEAPQPVYSASIPQDVDPLTNRANPFIGSIWLTLMISFFVVVSATIMLSNISERNLHERDEQLRVRFLRIQYDDATLIEIKLKWLKNMAKMTPSPLNRKNIQMLGYSPDELM